MAFLILPAENFPNETAAIIFTIVTPLIILFELRVLSKQRLTSGQHHDGGSFLVVTLFGIIIPLAAIFLFPTLGVGRIFTWISYLGLLALIAGFILRQWAIITLGKFFTPIVSVQTDHNIINAGPYRHLRHPSYSGLFLELLGAALATSNWLSAITVVVFFFPAISYRISIEETALKEKFGEHYQTYQHRTWRMIPFLY